MTVGTKSVLFGVHQFILHPLLVALGWKRLYGWPLSFRLWFCLFVHDMGYIGKTDMDSDLVGQTHPEWGAKLVERLFGKEWGDFCLYHSRFYSRAHGKRISKLCVADKLAFCMYPPWLYCMLANASGEMALYKQFSEDVSSIKQTGTDLEWYHSLRQFTLKVVIYSNRVYANHVRVGRHYHPHCNRRPIECSVGWQKPSVNRYFMRPSKREFLRSTRNATALTLNGFDGTSSPTSTVSDAVTD